MAKNILARSSVSFGLCVCTFWVVWTKMNLISNRISGHTQEEANVLFWVVFFLRIGLCVHGCESTANSQYWMNNERVCWNCCSSLLCSGCVHSSWLCVYMCLRLSPFHPHYRKTMVNILCDNGLHTQCNTLAHQMNNTIAAFLCVLLTAHNRIRVISKSKSIKITTCIAFINKQPGGRNEIHVF